MSDIFRTGEKDRPAVDLAEGEVIIAVNALKAKLERISQARLRLLDRQYPQTSAAYAMQAKADACVKLMEWLERDLSRGRLRNRAEVNLASEAISDVVTVMIRSGDVRDVRLAVIRDLLHRIQVGWKRVPRIPDEVLAQINQREAGRYYAKPVDVYAWVERETPEPYAWY